MIKYKNKNKLDLILSIGYTFKKLEKDKFFEQKFFSKKFIIFSFKKISLINYLIDIQNNIYIDDKLKINQKNLSY